MKTKVKNTIDTLAETANIEPNFIIPLGAKVQDLITDFAGIVVGRAQYLTGCNRYVVQPQKLEDGRLVDALSFDEMSLKVLSIPKLPTAAKQQSGLSGGPATRKEVKRAR